MPDTLTLLEKVTVGATAVSSITFNNIPQSYTDLVIKVSVRTARTNDAGGDDLKMYFNGDFGSNYTTKTVLGTGSAIAAENIASSNLGVYGIQASNASTGNTFGSGEYYIPNYAGSAIKTLNADTVSENNNVTAYMRIAGGTRNNTAAITSITFQPGTGPTFLQYSSFYLYGVTALGVTPLNAPKATGGDIIQTDGTFWYHAFLSSSTFRPLTSLSCDVLVVAGGAAGGAGQGGGGGAGGLLLHSSQSLTTTNYTVTIGGGGAGSNTYASRGANGSNSQFASLTASVGGGGGGTWSDGINTGANGGSGGGGAGDATTNTGIFAGGSATSGQGFAGGDGFRNPPNYRSGGGGGAGSAGQTLTTGSGGGNGGSGSSAYSSWASATGTGVSNAYAGGGGGGAGGSSGTSAGTGTAGGGNGGTFQNAIAPTNATANTGGGGGGGGGGAQTTSSSGGSGIVIVRYAV